MSGQAMLDFMSRGTAQSVAIVRLVLIAPALLFLLTFFVVPAAMMLSFSIQTQLANGEIGFPLNFQHYWRVFSTPLYFEVLVTTVRIAVTTAILTAVIGYPIAIVIARGRPWLSRIVMVIVAAPLVVSVIVRTYGWILVLANSNAGVLNWLLSQIGFGRAPLRLMYTETAVLIGSLHVFLPMMVLPLTSALARINQETEEAAATLGASSSRVFFSVVLPQSLPGLMAGLSIVFSLTAASFVTPAILGGTNGIMMGNLLYQQVMAVYDWPFGSAIGVVMVAMTFLVNGLLNGFLNRRRARGLATGEAA